MQRRRSGDRHSRVSIGRDAGRRRPRRAAGGGRLDCPPQAWRLICAAYRAAQGPLIGPGVQGGAARREALVGRLMLGWPWPHGAMAVIGGCSRLGLAGPLLGLALAAAPVLADDRENDPIEPVNRAVF